MFRDDAPATPRPDPAHVMKESITTTLRATIERTAEARDNLAELHDALTRKAVVSFPGGDQLHTGQLFKIYQHYTPAMIANLTSLAMLMSALMSLCNVAGEQGMGKRIGNDEPFKAG